MMNEEYKITLDAPYPPAKADGCNIFYASLLTNDFAGPVSELSAVTQYTFQSLASKDQKAAALVGGIAKIEMHHMQLIGQLIASLGGIPRFAVQNGCGTSFWNGQLIGYDSSARDFLRENIATEQAAIANYSHRIDQIDDNGVRAVLRRIILDEEHHIDLYGQLLAELDYGDCAFAQAN